jgi:hypothetical protein
MRVPTRTQRGLTRLEWTGLGVAAAGFAIGTAVLGLVHWLGLAFYWAGLAGMVLAFIGTTVERFKADRLFRTEHGLPRRRFGRR